MPTNIIQRRTVLNVQITTYLIYLHISRGEMNDVCRNDESRAKKGNNNTTVDPDDRLKIFM